MAISLLKLKVTWIKQNEPILRIVYWHIILIRAAILPFGMIRLKLFTRLKLMITRFWLCRLLMTRISIWLNRKIYTKRLYIIWQVLRLTVQHNLILKMKHKLILLKSSSKNYVVIWLTCILNSAGSQTKQPNKLI